MSFDDILQSEGTEMRPMGTQPSLTFYGPGETDPQLAVPVQPPGFDPDEGPKGDSATDSQRVPTPVASTTSSRRPARRDVVVSDGAIVQRGDVVHQGQAINAPVVVVQR